MFRKTIIPLVFVTIVLMLLFSCSKTDNPFDPNKSGYNGTVQENISFITALNPGDGGTITDVNSSTTEIEGEIEVYFADFMDANTITTSNIIVSDTLAGTSITNASLIYYPEIKKAVYRATFSNDGVYIVTLTSGLQNAAGIQFDGNQNEWVDGSPYDDYRYRLRTGSGLVDTFDFVHPEIIGFAPPDSNNASLTPVIEVDFSGGDVDTNTLTLSNIGLVKVSNQVSVPCSIVNRTPSFIQIQPTDSIDEAIQYEVTVKCANIKDESGNSCVGLVNENMGWIANIPDYTWDFITIAVDPDLDGTPPQVSSVNVVMEELIVSFNDDMDLSTFTTSNIKVYNNSTGQNLVGSIINEYDGRGFRYTLENAESGTTYKLWVSKDVKEAAPGNWNLDGNGNGVGGEWNDDYETTFTP